VQPPAPERITLEGPAGALEALIETPVAEVRPVTAFGVVCHPHPLHGGSLDNKVAWTLARAFQANGAPAIRFNFRGVGASSGHYADGRGETDDALAVIAYGRRRWPAAALWLGGFSFGGAVALRAAAQASAACLITVAPGITAIDVRAAPTPHCPWLIVQGDADAVVPTAQVLAWAATLSPAPEFALLPGASHFFHGRINELRDLLIGFLARRGPHAP
jgi:uncharacterized protein